MQRSISYSLRHGNDAQLPKVRTTSFGVESIAYLGNKLWQNLKQEIKQSSSLPIFKKQIRCWIFYIGKLTDLQQGPKTSPEHKRNKLLFVTLLGLLSDTDPRSLDRQFCCRMCRRSTLCIMGWYGGFNNNVNAILFKPLPGYP